MADRFLFDFFCARDVDDQAIIVKEFFARADIPQGLDENPAAAVFDRFAVWLAGMIDPPGFVSADGGIDHFFFVIEPEIICARIIEVLRNGRPQNTAPGVFDDARAFADRFGRENAATVHRRFAYFQMFRNVVGIGGARPGSALPLWSFRHKMNSKFVRKAVAPMEGGRDEIGAERSKVGEENGG
ncbi:MAG: hypothetical protein QOF93_510 [Verrucomicrobiota bacterium]